MSLEQILQENTAAIRELIAALQSSRVVAAEATVANNGASSPQETSSVRSLPAEAAAQEPAAGDVGAPPAAASDTPSDTPAPTYKDVADLVIKLHKTKGVEAALGVLHTFNPEAKNLKDINEADYSGVMAAIKLAMGE